MFVVLKKMRLFLFVFLVGYAVRCDESNNYYVIQMPDEDSNKELKKPFRVYWNVPTMQCRSKKVPFENLYDKFGIIQNENDDFRGGKISILYDPGLFPALLKNETSGKIVFRNGGVPQEGNLDKHLSSFRHVLEQSVTDPNFSGVGIIDFESWRPIFRQNFGVLVPYKNISYEIESRLHWWWPTSWIQTEAKKRFEEAARLFMQNTISLAKEMRPNALWGYYGFPYCFNMAANNMEEHCADNVPAENDMTYWLWAESTALFPSVYSSQELTSSQLAQLVRGRVSEAARVRRNGTPILPYFWFRYRDGGFMREVDLETALQTLYKSKASGLMIWGSSNDVNTLDKCIKLLNYIEKVLGPAVSKYTKTRDDVLNDEYITENEVNDGTTVNSVINTAKENITTQNPLVEQKVDTIVKIVEEKDLHTEFDWDSPENHTHDKIKFVEEELNEPGHNYSIENTRTHAVLNNLNNSLLIDMILDIFYKDNESEKETKADDKPFETKHDVLTTSLVYNPPKEVTDGYDLETSTYLGTDSPLFSKKNTDSITTEMESVSTTMKYETTKYTTENYEQSTQINEDYDQFHIKNDSSDPEEYFIPETDSEMTTEESNYRDFTTENTKQSTTEYFSFTETSDTDRLFTGTNSDFTTEVNFKTRITKSTNGSATVNADLDSRATSASSPDKVVVFTV